MPRRVGAQTLMLQIQPSILAGAAVAGKKEGEGPLGRSFDYICQDAYFGESSWEKAESAMLRRAFELACDKAGARNAAWLAAQILALGDSALRDRIGAERAKMRGGVEDAAAAIQEKYNA